MKLFCGIDWAEAHHDVAIIDENGQLVAKKRITDDPTGFTELIEALTTAGENADEPIPVAIETPRGLLVTSLQATGRLGGRCIRSTHWQSPATASDTRWHGRSPIALMPTTVLRRSIMLSTTVFRQLRTVRDWRWGRSFSCAMSGGPRHTHLQ